jgi:hypothetical protein
MGVLEVRRDGKPPFCVSFRESIGCHELVSGNQRSDLHNRRFTVLLPGHAHCGKICESPATLFAKAAYSISKASPMDRSLIQTSIG